MRKIARWFRRTRLKVRRWIADPAWDAVGLGVLSNLTGRMFLSSAAVISFLTAGNFFVAMLFMGACALDALVHLQALVGLRRLMAYEVREELIVRQLQPMLGN